MRKFKIGVSTILVVALTLGLFQFTVGEEKTVVEFEVPAIIVDNTDPGFTTDSPWVESTYSKTYYGTNYTHDGDDQANPDKWARWGFSVAKDGVYNVYMRWICGGNRVANAPVEISHEHGIDTSVRVNQTINDGKWVLLGQYSFEAGKLHYVKLFASDKGFTIADAIKIEPPPPPPEPVAKKSNLPAIKRKLSTNITMFIDSPLAYVFGEKKNIDENSNIASCIKNERTFVPLRFIAENLGASVSYNDQNAQITIELEGKKISMTVDRQEIKVNGKDGWLDAAPFVENGRTFVPVRAVSETFDKKVFWDERGLVLISAKSAEGTDAFLDQNILTDMITLFTYSTKVPDDLIYIEAESFDDLGGWSVDQQAMDIMGSPYLLAHGIGNPVEDATTGVFTQEEGEYSVWVRTRDWVAPWNAPGAPGRFKLSVNGKELDKMFGITGVNWHWQNGGKVALKNGRNEIALIDQTGFEGRCDAILFTKDSSFSPPDNIIEFSLFREKTFLKDGYTDKGEYDFVVVGGGIAGITAAVGAARLGLKVALIQDRPVLGGNNSSEVRVWLGGYARIEPYSQIGAVVSELEQSKQGHYGPANQGSNYEDDKKLQVVMSEKNIDLYLNYHANHVITAPDGSIRSVLAENIKTKDIIKVTGKLFSDCTGDGTIGYLSGADYEPQYEDSMGGSNLWYIEDTGKKTTFPNIEWGFDLTGINFPGRDVDDASAVSKMGCWYWEAGFKNDQILEAEYVRDVNLLGMYSAFNALKNIDKRMETYAIGWSSYVTGKRESNRLIGDYVLDTSDVFSRVQFPDAAFPTTWSVDLHYPDSHYGQDKLSDPFISFAAQTGIGDPYWVPYRTLYSRNIPNLFMAGRHISVTHNGLGTVRVMRTTGVMGEVVSMAAKVCMDHDALPRDVYTTYLDDLKGYMKKGVGKY